MGPLATQWLEIFKAYLLITYIHTYLLTYLGAHTAPPTLCTNAGMASGTPTPFAQLPLTMDDKFALMPRRVAAVYMNATASFEACQSREANDVQCGGGGKLATKASAKLAIRQRALALKDDGRATTKAYTKLALRQRALSLKGEGGARSRPGDGVHSVGHTPYWATPQCVLKRHLLAALPDLHLVDCLRQPGERPFLRLVRPR